MKLTKSVKAAGCAAKLGPLELSQVLGTAAGAEDPRVLVGYRNSDDAGVFQLTPEVNLVQTIDFFTPIVDDPFNYGQIAAANALSDVYAMGGTPHTALCVVCFPAKGIDFAVLSEIMRGGQTVLNEAKVALLGGHSIRDDEIKFGYAVTGTVPKDQIKQNKGAKPEDRVFLTKPLGTGLITTALKNEGADSAHVQEAIDTMRRLNRKAAEIAIGSGVNTMTDVTGFGLIGHASEVARASRITIVVDHRKLPLLPGAREYSGRGYCSGGLQSNRAFFSSIASIDDSISEEDRNLLFDPQTSGGLLLFCPAARAEKLKAALERESICAAEIGATRAASTSTLVEVI